MVVSQCRHVLAQCAAFVDGLDETDYTAPSERFFGATIGQHVRHTLDHYAAALGAGGEAIDYDHRERGTPIEGDAGAASARIAQLRGDLDAIATDCCARPVTIRVMLTAGGDDAELASNLARELAFASHHAIHHMAMMASIADERGVSIPDGFGKAPSTLEHQARAGA